MPIKVTVEYCGTCGYKDKFVELTSYLKIHQPDVEVNGFEGRRATFEVKINDTLVHSKLSTMAFPDYEDVGLIVSEVKEGQEIRKVMRQQPITSCHLM